MQLVTITNKTRATTVGTRIALADTFLMRLIGLLGRRRLDADAGLWIRPSSGVHTFGMLFAIDVVALDRQHRVHAVWPRLRPWRISPVSWKIHSVVELPAGSIQQRGIQTGDQLEILPTSPAVAGCSRQGNRMNVM
ncbi:MAG: DUF192 domain-containing protein [Acidobacteriaceae bacterium]